MHNIMKKTAAGAVMGGALLFTGGMGLATAQPVQVQDGLVNLAIGDVALLNDLDVAVAAQIAAAVCGLDVGPVAVLGEAVAAGGPEEVVCTNNLGPITIEQAGPGTSENAPGAANRPQR
ncbi:hypothetical protein [Mycobacterium sp. ITM-2016-00318]|uniref:hypothetical protein n=1 Tax=Mycobacterium sp. ITM-2016-00318 TaxID=2099693 RepID=UPI000CF948B0|nr:hypothetical protein [Mycobacterium sp. ITM-2016-00318]WNG93969.1 hypothetical protein C6A82_005815 [Mycobacterium sp. ITM-2016-00318]